jgi:hypothetical protein
VALLELSDKPKKARHNDQNTLEQRIEPLEVPSVARTDLWSALGKQNRPTARGNPFHLVVDKKKSTDPLAVSWVRQMRVRPDNWDVSFHMRTLE